MTPPRSPGYCILMLAACPFPANYGTPGCIKEMSEIMAELGHEVHVLTYPFGDDPDSSHPPTRVAPPDPGGADPAETVHGHPHGCLCLQGDLEI